MQANIINYRRGAKTQYNNQLLLEIDDKNYKNKKTASTLTGKKAIFKTESGKTITGKLAKAHGNKGIIRAKFERALPGNAIGKKIEIK